MSRAIGARRLSVYCSGSIVKGASDQKKLCWTEHERAQVRQGADPYDVVFLNPDDPITDPDNTLGQFGRDLYQVMVATAVIVDARERRGLGIGVEMAAASTLNTPVIVVAPRNSLYRADLLEYRGTTVKNYIHPHVASLATAVVDDFTAAGEVLRQLPPKARSRRTTPQWINAAVTEYRTNVLPNDEPMQVALRSLGVL